MGTIKEIGNGLFNRMKEEMGLMPEDVEVLVEERLEICGNCPIRDEGWCSDERTGRAVDDFMYKGKERIKGVYYSGCGCWLGIKTRSKKSRCPLGKWLNIE